MRLTVLGLGCLLALLSAGPAHAASPRLTVGQLTLGQLAALRLPEPAQSGEPALHLPAPCLGCQNAQVRRTSAGQKANGGRVRGGVSPGSGASPQSMRAQKLSNALYIGDTWRLAGGAELSLHLTPNEEHCAPLMRLTF